MIVSQLQHAQQVGQSTQTIQIQATSPATVQTLNNVHGVNVQRAQTLATYQQPSGETINVAIIQPLFIVNDQQGIIQQLEPLQAQPAVGQVALSHASSLQDAMVFPTPPPTAALMVAATETAPIIDPAPALATQPKSSEPEKPKRKPRRPPELIKAQREEYERKKIERHSVKPPCTCKFRCFEKLSEARRIEINRQYWQLPYDKQRDFILHSVEILDVKRRKKRKQKSGRSGEQTTELGADDANVNKILDCKGAEKRRRSNESDRRNAETRENGPEEEEEDNLCEDSNAEGTQNSEEANDEKKFRRGWTRVYSLKGDNGKFLTVCKAMFLTTLGFPEKVDGALRFLNKQQKGDIRARSPQRGKATPMKGATAKIDREVIKTHILSYKPMVVGRKKGQVRYLPGDLSIKKMHNDFRNRYTERNVSYTIYSEVFRGLNIVFRKDAKLT